nr:reverse transcriptase domain-containing protein [Tanacetum cinerariifolium]
MTKEEELLEPWILFIDGSSCTDGSGAGLILTNPEGAEFTYALRFGFDATNNEAEYEALISGLKIAEQTGIKNLKANVDSRLVANQVNEIYAAKETDMTRYLEKVKALTSSFIVFSIKQVPRSENKKADVLSKIASTSFAHLSKQVLVEELKEKSISTMEVLAVVEEEGDTWMTPIFKYLTDGTLPIEIKKARAVRRKSWRFAIINGTLYKKSFFGPWLRKQWKSSWNDFSVFGYSFSFCLTHLDKMLKRCEDTNLVLNWEKCHFMVKEGIVLGHKNFKSRIKVDKAKVDVIAKLPHPPPSCGMARREDVDVLPGCPMLCLLLFLVWSWVTICHVAVRDRGLWSSYSLPMCVDYDPCGVAGLMLLAAVCQLYFSQSGTWILATVHLSSFPAFDVRYGYMSQS